MPTKLTAKQQEVVNLMADGWGLVYTRSAWGGRIKGSAALKRQGEKNSRRYPLNMPSQLAEKGVVEVAGKLNVYDTVYVLTELGASLAKPIENLKKATWYFIGGYHLDITTVEVEGATQATVTINGRRQSKVSEYGCYFPTREAAIAYGVECLQRKVAQAEKDLEYARAALAAFNKQEGQG